MKLLNTSIDGGATSNGGKFRDVSTPPKKNLDYTLL